MSSDQDVCDEAKKGTIVTGAPAPSGISDQCSTAATFQVLQFVFLGAGVVSAGIGTYLILSSDSGSESAGARRQRRAARFAPRLAIGPHGGKLDVALAF